MIRTKGLYSILISTLLLCQVSSAQQSPIDSFPSSCWRDARNLFHFPRYYQSGDTWLLAGGAICTGAGFFADESLEHYLRDQGIREEKWTKRSDIFSAVGNGILPGIGAVVLYAAGEYGHRDEWKRTALLQMKTLVFAAGVSRIPKVLAQRHRPETEINSWRWEGPFNGFTGNYSFTSGHTFIAFSWAAVTAQSMKENRGWGIAAYALAGLTGASRIYQGEHWLSDVVGGALLGTLFGKLMWRIQQPCETRKKRRVVENNPFQ